MQEEQSNQPEDEQGQAPESGQREERAQPSAKGGPIWRMAGGPARQLLSEMRRAQPPSREAGPAQPRAAEPLRPSGMTLAALQSGGARPEQAAGPWQMAGGPASRTLAAIRAERPATPVAAPALQRTLISRRTFILGGFWTGLGLAITSALGGLDFMYPRKVTGFGAPITVPAEQVPKPGEPAVHINRGKFWLVNLSQGEGAFGEFGEAGEGGVLCLWQKCPHLGCTVPWRNDFVFGGVKSWFRCPCHGSTYTKAGVRVFGPAPRPMDTMEIKVNDDRSITVNTGKITQGGNNNPRRAVPYS